MERRSDEELMEAGVLTVYLDQPENADVARHVRANSEKNDRSNYAAALMRVGIEEERRDKELSRRVVAAVKEEVRRSERDLAQRLR